jgi:hypothetical protein
VTAGRGEGRRSGAARALRLAGGWALLAVGVPLLVLPGPGIPFVVAGLAVLARESPWAARLRARLLARLGRQAHSRG